MACLCSPTFLMPDHPEILENNLQGFLDQTAHIFGHHGWSVIVGSSSVICANSIT